MQLAQNQKRLFSILIILALCVGLMAALAAPAQAAEVLPQELYVEQSRSGVCTLASSVMLVRSTLYLYGSSHWTDATESTVGAVAWRYGAGLVYSWTYETAYASIRVDHTELSGITADALKALLDAHPEGIVFYCIGCPHAVFLTDYEGDTFYCADPAPYCSGARIPLAESWLGKRYGFDQEAVLANASAYWSVTECTVKADMDVIPMDTLQKNTVMTAAKEDLNTWYGKLVPSVQ